MVTSNGIDIMTELMEIGLAPECVHTDPREKKYYLMKRFVHAAVNYAEKVKKTTVKIVASLYETPLKSLVMVNDKSLFNDVSDIFCTSEFTNDERREILKNIKVTDTETMECEAASRGYLFPGPSVFAVITF